MDYLEHIDKIIYINLDKRADRCAEIESEFVRMGIPVDKVIRFSAIEKSMPNAGCNLSHAGALRLAAKLGLRNCLILEDDFNFIEDAGEVQRKLSEFFSEATGPKEWDIVQLAHYVYEGKAWSPTLGVARRASNAAGYLVNSHMFEPLAETIEAAASGLEKTGQHWVYQNDVVWCRHMAAGRWFYFLEPLGYQRTSFSNLAGQVVTHKRKL